MPPGPARAGAGGYRQALELFREAADRDGEAEALNGRGRQHWQRALDIYTGLGVPEAAHVPTIIAEPRLTGPLSP